MNSDDKVRPQSSNANSPVEPAPTNPAGAAPSTNESELDKMREVVEEEKRGIEHLDAKIREAQKHEEQLRRD